MSIETLADTRALFNGDDFAEQFNVVGNNDTLRGLFSQGFAQSYDINGRESILRCVNEDTADLAIGDQLDRAATADRYTLREIRQHQRTTELVLEQV